MISEYDILKQDGTSIKIDILANRVYIYIYMIYGNKSIHFSDSKCIQWKR